MREALRATQAERAAMHIRKRIAEPRAGGPCIVEGSEAKRSKMRRVAVREQKERHVNLLLGDVTIKVLVHPPKRSFVDKACKWGGVQNAVEDAEGFLLRLIRALSECPLQCLEESKTQRGDARRQSWRNMGSEKVKIMKGPLDTPEDMPRNAPLKVISEAIECTE